MFCVDPMLMVKTVAILSPFHAFTLKRLRRSSMQVGDLVRMRGGLPALGIVLSTECDGKALGYRCIGDSNRPLIERVQVHWVEDAEVSWEPIKWLEVISA
jgi:hypothetical protein